MNQDSYFLVSHIPYGYLILLGVAFAIWLYSELKVKRKLVRIVISVFCASYALFFCWNVSQISPIATNFTLSNSLYLIEDNLDQGKVNQVLAALKEFERMESESSLLEASIYLQHQLQTEEIQTQ